MVAQTHVTQAHPETVVGNVYDKYHSRNPIARWLMRGFLDAVGRSYKRALPTRVLEVGCGEGELAAWLVHHGPRPETFVACDLSLERLSSTLDPLIEAKQASIYALPFPDASFDLVICCEVLEHLTDPEAGLREVTRVASRHVIVSTPREPLWRLMNLARGRYVSALGNTPGHVQHFSRQRLLALVERHLHVVSVKNPIPWTVILGSATAPRPAR